jgi:hypothetical protein
MLKISVSTRTEHEQQQAVAQPVERGDEEKFHVRSWPRYAMYGP